MPVYRSSKPKGKPVPLRVIRVERVASQKGKRIYSRSPFDYTFDHSSLRIVAGELRFDIAGWLRHRMKKSSRLNVLDWGCGAGLAMGELQREFGPHIQMIGYSKHSYPEWRREEGVIFIHGVDMDLFRYTKRAHLRFDLIYSNMGTIYLMKDPLPKLVSPTSPGFETAYTYVEKLATLLKPGGIIVLGTHDRIIVNDEIGLDVQWEKVYTRLKREHPEWHVKKNKVSFTVQLPDPHV
ncbi:MAG: methyltransferase domain-containing protein [Candidatus Diapherotrites archaeon]|nr:methyltransferase domain-containing protein [Candidatus Diapherotrites archaeon]